MHKTGTTSVQQTLVRNAKNLEELGYRVFVNLPEMNAKNTECFNPAWLRDQVKVAEKHGLHAIIFSAEVISTFNSKQLNNLLEAFYDYEVNIIACFRHWVGFLPSRWAQNCFRRDAQSFPAYLSNLRNHEKIHIDARFDLIIRRMIAANPYNIRLISYDNAVVLGALLPTILSAFDLPQNFVNNIQESSRRYNTSKDAETVELVRLFNGIYSIRNALETNGLFMALLYAIPVGEVYDFSRKIGNILQDHKKLQKQLLDIVNEKRTKILLSRKDSSIARWEKMTEEAAGSFIINPQQSKLFCDIPDTEVICSEIEADDLPVSIQEEMAAAFGIGES